VVIVETPTFTRLIREVLDEESYRLLQLELAADPGKGALIPGTGGVRKVRWAASGRGKSGGARVIYYWAKSREVVLMLAAYAKNDQVNLTPAQSNCFGILSKGSSDEEGYVRRTRGERATRAGRSCVENQAIADVRSSGA
jgi:hypothetical protein